MKCDNFPLLWRNFFLNFANNRDYIINYCNGPFIKFDKHCREWLFSYNSYDNEIRVLDNLNSVWCFYWMKKDKTKREPPNEFGYMLPK